ncbi:hypothetical protein QP868_02140 [Brevibacterium sp. UMB1308A]|uniref:hypothetical protein n=1 Tax=Brevibacterium sp. UMB1308A TaxID=3050608 RepID=UPI0025504B58|nr:hypothetical protein [Brevibacterium sp. UMB1308A]MDK8345456.1 hypothetical protein [Brevibacterium sp. UMB1308B]MDK8712698.1 hypothetical protein [Brevibacterium sp. UMB1308A]
MARRSEKFARLSLDYADHPKIVGLSDAAFRAHVELILYSRKYLTDGVIGKQIAKRLLPHVLKELLNNDDEAPSLIALDNGDYLLHGFCDMQETKAEVEAKRLVRAEAGRKGGLAKKQNAKQIAKQIAKQTPSKRGSKNVAEKEKEKEKEISNKPWIGADAPSTGKNTTEQKHINEVTSTAYEAIGKAANWNGLRAIAKWCLKDRGLTPEQFRDACVHVYRTGKPITKQTIGQHIDGVLDQGRLSFDAQRHRANDAVLAHYMNQQPNQQAQEIEGEASWSSKKPKSEQRKFCA